MLKSRHAISSSLIVALLVVVIQSSAMAVDEAAFFESKIRPVLAKHCYACHSADAAKSGNLDGGLQLDTRAGVRRGGDTGPAVVPQKPEESLLLAAVQHQGGLEMPPDAEQLSPAVIADLKRWIEMGAHDPRDGQPAEATFDYSKAQDFWSLQPIQTPSLPEIRDPQWPRQPLDYFILSQLEARQAQPAGDAARNVLLRRLYFDLIGLPPAPEELERFESRPLEEVVDHLLASPHFGERWGRHWLDLARFAESNGRARNMAWHHAWRYRDWVIDSYNSDTPYDRFLVEQIAGDLLPSDSAAQRDRQVIATGFLALGPKSLEERKRELFVMDVIDEQIDVICRGILGLSASCARCHDHKFDPIPTRDYYALAGILDSTKSLYGIGPMGIKGVNDSALAVIGPAGDSLAIPAMEHMRAVQDKTQERNTARSDRYRIVRRVADFKRQLALPDADAQGLGAEISELEQEIETWDERIEQLDKQLEKLVATPPAQPQFAMAVTDAEAPEDCHVRVRGDPDLRGDRVPRGVLAAIPASSPPIDKSESGRLQLAMWLTDHNNPLTARVMVNRIWQRLFGRGIVATPDDFGATGSRPSHPLLLDHLSARWKASGWSTKQLIREIVLSRTYGLSSDASAQGESLDPDNLLLGRMPVRRLEAEPLRDALLKVSGQLNPQRRVGSAVQQIGVFSNYEFNARVKLTPAMLRSHHRSIYLPVVRGQLPETLSLFDFADPNALVGRRDETTTPAQALFLLNSPDMIQWSRHTAENLLSVPEWSDAERLQRLYQMAFGRLPSTAESTRAAHFLSEAATTAIVDSGKVVQSPLATAASQRLEAWASLCQVVMSAAEFRHLK